jgi:hypothetical protein
MQMGSVCIRPIDSQRKSATSTTDRNPSESEPLFCFTTHWRLKNTICFHRPNAVLTSGAIKVKVTSPKAGCGYNLNFLIIAAGVRQDPALITRG